MSTDNMANMDRMDTTMGRNMMEEAFQYPPYMDLDSGITVEGS